MGHLRLGRFNLWINRPLCRASVVKSVVVPLVNPLFTFCYLVNPSVTVSCHRFVFPYSTDETMQVRRLRYRRAGVPQASYNSATPLHSLAFPAWKYLFPVSDGKTHRGGENQYQAYQYQHAGPGLMPPGEFGGL